MTSLQNIENLDFWKVQSGDNFVPLLFGFKNRVPHVLEGWNFETPKNAFLSYFERLQNMASESRRRLKIWGFTLQWSKITSPKFQPFAISFKDVLEPLENTKLTIFSKILFLPKKMWRGSRRHLKFWGIEVLNRKNNLPKFQSAR